MYETDDPEDLIRNIFPPIRTIVPQEVSHQIRREPKKAFKSEIIL